MSTTLGLLQGFMETDHRVPADCTVVVSKICELCGCQMFVPGGIIYCPECQGSLFSVFFQEALDKVWNLERENQILSRLEPRLSFIKIRFKGAHMEGPVTLNVGQSMVASINGYDQYGQPWAGAIPTPRWSVDNPALDSIAQNGTVTTSEDVTSLAAGTANLTVGLTSAEGKTLTDTEVVTNLAPPPPPAVLSSIKINFSTPQP